jgi:ankyrin repeat protein
MRNSHHFRRCPQNRGKWIVRANVNVARLDGWTPVCEAAYEGHLEMVTVLASLGANVNDVV